MNHHLGRKGTKGGLMQGIHRRLLVAMSCAFWLLALPQSPLVAQQPPPLTTPVVITVDNNCSLANAIRSANGDDQVEEADDADGNDDCEDGTEPREGTASSETGEDIIRLTANITLAETLPSITSQIQIDGGSRSVSGDDTYPVFAVQGGVVSISDITITNGATTTYGGGISVDGGELNLSSSKIKDSAAGDIGGGIYATDSNVDILDSELTGNSTSQSHGGGMYFVSSDGSHTLTIGGDQGSTFKKNTSAEDGGALKIAGGTVSITKSTFSENSADEGGAIESSNATLTAFNSTFSNNSAREGGGLSSFGSDVILRHTTWAFNSAEEQGGGIAIVGWLGSFRILNTLITDSKSGGDCHPGPNPDIIIEFTGNFIKDGSCTPEEPEETEESTEESQQQSAEDLEPDVLEADAQAQENAPSSSEDQDAELQAQHSEDQDAELQAQHSGEHDDELAREPEETVDPKIASLTGNPPHHPLQQGSPAIDAADPEYCLNDDQPGTNRPQYENCDIGAYEYPKPPEPQPPADPPERDDPPSDPTPPETEDPPPTPTQPPNICIVNGRIIVRSPNDDVHCAEIDVITLDKHPELQGVRFAMRLWRSNRNCMHIVADGDNLYRLAIRYDTTVEILKRHNNLPSSQLTVGQHLLLPSCPTEAATFDPGTEVCFKPAGGISLIDTSVPERTIHSIPVYASEDMTCGKIDRPGIVVLIASESG